MTRKELYDWIRKTNNQKNVLNTFGKNFTNVSTDYLQRFYNAYSSKTKPSNPSVNTKNINKAFVKLVSILAAEEFITSEEADNILSLI